MSKMSKQGNASFQKELQEIRRDKIVGKLAKRFQDEFFALDLLKVIQLTNFFVDHLLSLWIEDMFQIRTVS